MSEVVGAYIQAASGTAAATGTENVYGIRIANQGGATNDDNSYGLYVDAQSGATNSYAAVFAGGNVGIGTASPLSKLHVSLPVGDTAEQPFNIGDANYGFRIGKTVGAGSFDPSLFGYSKGSGYSGMSFTGRVESGDNTGTVPVVAVYAQTTAAAGVSRPTFGIYNGTTIESLFYNSATAGNVGINWSGKGASNMPTERLHIIGDSNSTGTHSSVYLEDIRVATNSRNWLIANTYNGDYGQLTFFRSTTQGGAASTVAALFNKDGNFGLGTTSKREEFCTNLAPRQRDLSNRRGRQAAARRPSDRRCGPGNAFAAWRK
jgi:hypothetical protein